MISLGSRLIACCKLTPTLARQMWRHNYVTGRNEYQIFTFSKSINPWVYSLQFLFKSTNNPWRYERKFEWVFFSEHSVYFTEIWRYNHLQNGGRLPFWIIKAWNLWHSTVIVVRFCVVVQDFVKIGHPLSSHDRKTTFPIFESWI